jgi:beta-N-acetylhexosaminidase
MGADGRTARDSGTTGTVIYRARVSTSRLPVVRPRPAAALAAAGLAATLSACGASAPEAAPSTTAASTEPTPESPSPRPSVDPTKACVENTLAEMDEGQRLGQLLMVGFDTNAPQGALDELIGTEHVGNVIYLGGWEGAPKVSATSEHLQGLVSGKATAGIGLMIAADQEGGEVHQLRGEGFTWPPSALEQGQMDPDALTEAATGWAEEIKAVGVNVNLAPVADTVPESLGRGNGPIGQWGRQYGYTPKTVERGSVAFLEGMLAGGVEPTVKHFPGIGRITNNTDFFDTGITDDQTGPDDPYLRPFQAGIDAGAGLVMVGSAYYSKLDPGVPAMFSEKIVTGLLREQMGFDGVVITDDVNAQAVRQTPPAQRAVAVLRAGGDIVLTGDASVATAMLDAVAAEAADDDEFADTVDAAVERVLRLKYRMGLLPCSAAADD